MHLGEALTISPHDVGALNELGTVQLARGDIKEAVKRYTEAVALDPSHAESHHNLGMAFFKQGDLKKALKQFSEALRISPDNANVRYNVEKVSRLLDQSPKTPTGSQLH